MHAVADNQIILCSFRLAIAICSGIKLQDDKILLVTALKIFCPLAAEAGRDFARFALNSFFG